MLTKDQLKTAAFALREKARKIDKRNAKKCVKVAEWLETLAK